MYYGDLVGTQHLPQNPSAEEVSLGLTKAANHKMDVYATLRDEICKNKNLKFGLPKKGFVQDFDRYFKSLGLKFDKKTRKNTEAVIAKLADHFKVEVKKSELRSSGDRVEYGLFAKENMDMETVVGHIFGKFVTTDQGRDRCVEANDLLSIICNLLGAKEHTKYMFLEGSGFCHTTLINPPPENKVPNCVLVTKIRPVERAFEQEHIPTVQDLLNTVENHYVKVNCEGVKRGEELFMQYDSINQWHAVGEGAEKKKAESNSKVKRKKRDDSGRDEEDGVQESKDNGEKAVEEKAKKEKTESKRKVKRKRNEEATALKSRRSSAHHAAAKLHKIEEGSEDEEGEESSEYGEEEEEEGSSASDLEEEEDSAMDKDSDEEEEEGDMESEQEWEDEGARDKDIKMELPTPQKQEPPITPPSSGKAKRSLNVSQQV